MLYRRYTTRLAICFATALAALSNAAYSQEVGTAAAVNPSAQARGKGGSRTIHIGHTIAHRERIQTTSAGSVQLLFVDKTSITVGPNSDLAIDEYVYDPNTNSGKLAANLTKGVMRFVGGQISHSGNAQITTPTAVVGIRGGVAIVGTSQVFMGYGQGTVTTGSSSVTLQPGEYTQTKLGGPPTNPGPPPQGFVGSLLTNFQSRAGQGGGAPASVARVNQARAAVTGSQSGVVVAQPPANPVQGENQSGVLSNVNQSIMQSNSQKAALQTLPPTPPQTTLPPAPTPPLTPTATPLPPSSPPPSSGPSLPPPKPTPPGAVPFGLKK